MRRVRPVIAAALPLLLVACAGSSTPTAAPTAPATATADLVESPPSGATLTPATQGSEVAIALVDYAFRPDAISVPAGRTTFVLDNQGEQEHEFEILDGDSVVDEVEGLVPGLTRDLTVDLGPGSYTIVCRLADHEARGMIGTLTVTGG